MNNRYRILITVVDLYNGDDRLETKKADSNSLFVFTSIGES